MGAKIDAMLYQLTAYTTLATISDQKAPRWATLLSKCCESQPHARFSYSCLRQLGLPQVRESHWWLPRDDPVLAIPETDVRGFRLGKKASQSIYNAPSRHTCNE